MNIFLHNGRGRFLHHNQINKNIIIVIHNNTELCQQVRHRNRL